MYGPFLFLRVQKYIKEWYERMEMVSENGNLGMDVHSVLSTTGILFIVSRSLQVPVCKFQSRNNDEIFTIKVVIEQ